MAIDKYLIDTSDTFLEDILAKKKVSLANSRIANVQSAVMYMQQYKNNGLLVDQLYEIINVNLHQLQEQVLIQTEIVGIKKALSQCKGIKESIYNLTENNVEELKNIETVLLSESDGSTDNQEAEKLMKEMVEGLKVISSRKPTGSQEKEEIQQDDSDKYDERNMEIKKHDSSQEENSGMEWWFNSPIRERLIFVRIDASKLSLGDKFMEHKPKTEKEREFKYRLSEIIKAGIKDFYKPIYAPSLSEDGQKICYAVGKMPAVGKSYSWWERTAREFYPARKSHLGNSWEYIAFLGVIIKKLVADGVKVATAWDWVCNDSKKLGNYRNSYKAKGKLESTGSREVLGFYDLGNTYKILSFRDNSIYCDDSKFNPNKISGFWINGGSYEDCSGYLPLASRRPFLLAINGFNYLNGVGWIVLEE